MKKLAILCFIATFIYGCNVDTSPELSDDLELSEAEIALSLPPEPDKTLNSSTFKGVDSNNNLIRDDIEREIGVRFYPDMSKISLLNNVAKANTLLYQAYQNKDLALYKENIAVIDKISSCLIFNEDLSDDDVEKYLVKLYENTPERLETLLLMDIEFSNMEPAQEPVAVKMDIDQSECNNLMN